MANNTNPKNRAASGITPLAAGTLQIASITSSAANNKLFITEDVTLTVTFNEAAAAETEPVLTFTNPGFTVKTPWTLDSDRTKGTIVLTAGADFDKFTVTAALTDGNTETIDLVVNTKEVLKIKTFTVSKTDAKVGDTLDVSLELNRKRNIDPTNANLELPSLVIDTDFLDKVQELTVDVSNPALFTAKVKTKKAGNVTISGEATDFFSSAKDTKSASVNVTDVVTPPVTPTSGISIKNITVTPTEVERTQSVTVKVEFNKAAADGDFKVTSIGLEEVSPMTLAGDKLSASGTFKATMLGEVSVGAYILPNLTSPVKATVSVKPSSTPEVIAFSSLPTGGVDTPLTQEESFKIFRYLFYPDVTRS